MTFLNLINNLALFFDFDFLIFIFLCHLSWAQKGWDQEFRCYLNVNLSHHEIGIFLYDLEIRKNIYIFSMNPITKLTRIFCWYLFNLNKLEPCTMP